MGKMTKPRISITSQQFKYTSSDATNVAATFRRVRREMAAAEAAKLKAPVTMLKRGVR